MWVMYQSEGQSDIGLHDLAIDCITISQWLARQKELILRYQMGRKRKAAYHIPNDLDEERSDHATPQCCVVSLAAVHNHDPSAQASVGASKVQTSAS